jgi:hypothetical protein
MQNVNLGLVPLTGNLKRMAQSEVARLGIVDTYDDDVGSI